MTETETQDFSGLEVVNERIVAFAPAELFDAFADPHRLAQWWGPEGFTNDIKRFDFQVGGEWRMIMRSSSGAEFDNSKTFIAIEPDVRVVVEHHQPVHRFLMTMAFAPHAAGTALTWRLQFSPESETENLGPFLRQANEQNLDRLEAHLKAYSAKS